MITDSDQKTVRFALGGASLRASFPAIELN